MGILIWTNSLSLLRLTDTLGLITADWVLPSFRGIAPSPRYITAFYTWLVASSAFEWIVVDSIVRIAGRRLFAGNGGHDQDGKAKGEHTLERRYVASLLGLFMVFVILNCRDYLRYSSLIAAYDVILTFGTPVTMVSKGGAMVVKSEIIWGGLVANVILVLSTTTVVAWLWNRIASR